jgi:putative hydrolase of the HAD superfamily
LFDADGVVQRTAVPWRDSFAKLLKCNPEESVVDDFMSDVFRAEQPALTGEADFMELLPSVLSRWDLKDRIEEILQAWIQIEVFPYVREAIKKLRAQGLICCLATNQQKHRAEYMSINLGYGDLFDHEFYSCFVGAAKPDPEYFKRILGALALDPAAVLFLDDHANNVESAMTLGMNAEVFDGSSGHSGIVTIFENYGLAG